MSGESNKCDNCPFLYTDTVCKGLQHRRFCQLVDPNNESYNPLYIESMKRDALNDKTPIVAVLIKPKPNPTPETKLETTSESKPQTFSEKAEHFFGSMTQFALSGFATLPAEVSNKRLEICKSNKCGFFDQEKTACKKCSCFLKIKTTFPHESCPIGEWGPVNVDGSPIPVFECGGCSGK